MPSPLDYLKFADNTYSDPMQGIPSGWKVIQRVENNKTSHSAVVYRNETTGEIVIAHKGSVETQDFLVDDALIASGKLPPQLILALRLTKEIIKSYPNAKISQTGHSLGAFLAELTATWYNQKAVTFDGPGNGMQIDKLNKIKKLLGKKTESSDITSYISDPNLVNSAAIYLGRRGNTVYLSDKKEKFFLDIRIGYKLAQEVHLTGHIYKYFEPSTGAVIPHCVTRKADEVVRTYSPKEVNISNQLATPLERTRQNILGLKNLY